MLSLWFCQPHCFNWSPFRFGQKYVLTPLWFRYKSSPASLDEQQTITQVRLYVVPALTTTLIFKNKSLTCPSQAFCHAVHVYAIFKCIIFKDFCRLNHWKLLQQRVWIMLVRDWTRWSVRDNNYESDSELLFSFICIILFWCEIGKKTFENRVHSGSRGCECMRWCGCRW